MSAQPKPEPEEQFDSVVKNALDFLEQSVAELKKRPKSSLIDFCSAVELLLKARLMREHWTLIVAKNDNPSIAKFKNGDFRSVSMEETVERLERVAGEALLGEEWESFRAVRQHRNKLVHFYHEKYIAADKAAVEQVVIEQCRAWFYLHRLLTGRWSAHFKSHAKAIDAAHKKMQGNRNFLKAKYEALQPDIKKQIALGVEYIACSSCGFGAAHVQEECEPLFTSTCEVCGVKRNFLRVPCPQCEETITIRDPASAAECPNEDFEVNLEWLIENYGDRSEPAYCAYFEHFEPTVVPCGEKYLCLACPDIHESVDECDWCGALNGSLGSDSYLGGCAVCDGKFGSESFARE